MIPKQQWNNFISNAPGGSFLQSWEWGQLQAELRVPHWRMWERDGEAITGLALVIKRQLPWGRSWLYVPRGPVGAAGPVAPAPPPGGAVAPAGGGPPSRHPQISLLKQLIELAQQEKAMFVRIEPPVMPGEGWRKAVSDVQPRHTLVVDLTKPEDVLLSEMHQKTRYNIHVAAKRGVTVRFSSDPEDLTHFFRLSREVSGRAAFSFHPDEYYRAMLTALTAGPVTVGPSRSSLSSASPSLSGWGPSEFRSARALPPRHPQLIAKAELAIAEHEGDILAAHILVSFGDTVTYVHGASSGAKRNLMAPHLLQWESIKRARAAGYARYDFFGVAPKSPAASGTAGHASHPWAGITKFKEGFGGQRVSSVGAYDYVLGPVWYWAYATGRNLRRFLR